MGDRGGSGRVGSGAIRMKNEKKKNISLLLKKEIMFFSYVFEKR